MDLWSKGLGKLVLGLRLSERSQMIEEDGAIAIRGNMGKPVFWDYAVYLKEEDVVDFLGFLRQPPAIRYMIASDQRWKILRTALEGAVLFAWRIICLLLGVAKPIDHSGEVLPTLKREAEIEIPDDIAKEIEEAERNG
jgi:hypothetical protein